MKPDDVACVVLASGKSERFGVLDKLEANLCGKAVLDHVLEMVQSIGFGGLFVVTQDRSSPYFTTIKNHNLEAGQGHALRLGLGAAQNAGWDCIAVVLGDMPLITAFHIEKMLKKLGRNDAVVSILGDIKMPPALFRRSAVSLILEGNSTTGARTIFSQLNSIAAPIHELEALDVDTPEDLIRVEGIMKARLT